MSIKDKACKRCGACAKGAVVPVKGQTAKVGDAHALCGECLAIVHDIVVNGADIVIANALQNNTGDIVVLNWRD